MLTGVSTACLYPMHTEDSLYELAKLGVENAEIFFNATEELDGPILRRIRSITDNFNMQITSVHPFNSPMESLYLFSDYDRRFMEICDIYKRYFNVMNEFGASVFVLHGAIRSAVCDDDFYIEQYHKLYEIGKSFGIKVGQENVSYCKSSDLPFLRRMSDELKDDVAFVLDIKQAVRSGCSPFEIIDTLGAKICHYHISDHREGADCLPVGKGCFNFEKMIRRLSGLDYDGAVILELYSENFSSVTELKDSINTIDEIVAKFF